MTYLELVNKVLIRLREDTVDAFVESPYALLISELVLDAYKIVEDSHDWSVLREDIAVATTPSNPEIELTDVPVDSTIYDVYYTDNRALPRRNKSWLERRKLFQATTEGEPEAYIVSRANPTNGNLILEIFPTPDQAYNLEVITAKRGSAPSTGADSIVVPVDPVLYLSCAFATRERGETGGTSAAEYMNLFQASLSSAISRDATHREDEINFYV